MLERMPLSPPWRITSPFGPRRLTIDGVTTTRDHQGTDLSAAVGTPLYAMGAGFVRAVDVVGAGGGGRTLTIVDDADGEYTYAHLQTVAVVVGQRVRPGQQVGTTGATGRVTGPHLHVQWRPVRGGPLASLDEILPILAPPAPPVADAAPSGSGSGSGPAVALVVAAVALLLK